MEEIKLYEGKELLLFDKVLHQYFWNDEQLPSATQITKNPNSSKRDRLMV